MIVHVHRGQNRIGGSIIEVSDGKTRLFFDVGIDLEESGGGEVPPIEGLFSGAVDCDGVFLSHYHADHVGLTEKLLDGIPVFMGERAYTILSAAAEYRDQPLRYTPCYVRNREAIVIGEFSVTPLLCDHSAFDSYMFMIENAGKKVLYTGDFRANGRLDFEQLLAELPVVDALIVEGTTLTREGRENIQEERLEQIAVEYLRGKNGPVFMMQSAQNIDRLITARNVADKTGRVLLQDVYTARIAQACGVPFPNRRVFMTGGDRQYAQLQAFSDVKIGKREIANTSFLMCVRQSMKNYLAGLNELVDFEGGVLFYGMWKGYMEQPEMQDFLRFMTERGVSIHVLHTSGHADSITIDRIVKRVCPRVIVPVHTENAAWFSRYRTRACIATDPCVEV